MRKQNPMTKTVGKFFWVRRVEEPNLMTETVGKICLMRRVQETKSND